MKALALAAALRMEWPAVQNIDAKLQQPYPETCPARARCVAPRRAVIHEHGFRQAIAPKRDLELPLHCVALFVGTGRKTNRKARMVIHDGQGMAARLVRQRYPALEVDLPQQIRCFHLKALVGAARRDWRLDPAVTAQDSMHGRQRWWRDPHVLKTTRDLARPPCRMRVTHRQYMLFHHGLATARAPMWTTRPVRQLFIARFPALDPFVANIRADPEPAAKFAPVRPFLHRQSNKLTPLAHGRHLLPRHGWPPLQPNPCNDEVSAMSPNTRQSCPRDEHLTRG